ncbi:hypothetical protein AWC38_SpisGene13526 [Stylophora pistillata]|uniref:Uncharacterized protein n=1 Tax=Stylophora pistillata TaxID=50429 RepID=A0A2B4S0D9_STYPI|nr:hypothetical protein AWC38_SpisGene13526 [Stylophora pistillata]
MLHSDDGARPQRRSALVARELSRLNVDIAALREVHFAEEVSVVEPGEGYTLFWSGRGKEEQRQSGVGFMMKNAIANKLHTLPVGHSDRIMSLRLPIQGDHFVMFVSVYRLTLQADLGGNAQCRLLHRPQACPHQSCLHVQAITQGERPTDQETPSEQTPKPEFVTKLAEKLLHPPNPGPNSQWQNLKNCTPRDCSSCHNLLLSKPDDSATKAAYRAAYSAVQARLRASQNDWWIALAERT